MSRGYDNTPVLQQTVLDIPMFEGTGALAHDISRQVATDKTMTLVNTPAWYSSVLSNTMMLDLDSAGPDHLVLAAASCADLNFTTGSFSGAVWIYAHTIIGSIRTLMCRGLTSTDGWFFAIGTDGYLYLVTNQAAANQVSFSANGSIVAVAWYLVGFTRFNATVKVFRNGANITSTSNTHVDPLTSARDLHVGVYDDHTWPFDGYMWRPRIWNRLLSELEFAELFQQERHLFGV
jgi:hypothetical protein